MKRMADWIIPGFLALALLLGQWGRLETPFGFPFYLFDLFALLVFIRVAVKIPHLKSPLSAALGMLFLSLAFSLAVNSWRLTGWEFFHSALYLFRLIVYSGIYFYVRATPDFPWIEALVFFGTVFGLLALVQFFLMPDMRALVPLGFDPHYFRLAGTLFDPNFTGVIISLTLLATIGGAGLRQAKAGVFLLLIVVQIILVLVTFSRTAIFSFFTGLLVCVLGQKKPYYLLGFVLVLVFFLAVPKADYISLDLTRTETVVARLENLTAAWGAFTRSPVIGLGFNTLTYTVAPAAARRTVIPSRSLSGFDNSYLVILVTGGLVATIIFLNIVREIVSLLKSVFTRDPSFGVLVASNLAAIGAASLSINALFFPHVMVWLSVILGVSENFSGDGKKARVKTQK